jgi:hypothetical protein
MEGRKEERERGDFKDRKLNFREIKWSYQIKQLSSSS